MKISPEGLVPARGFLEQGMAPRPSFNDGSAPGEFYDSLAICEHTLRFVVLCFTVFGVGGDDAGEKGLLARDQIRFLRLKGAATAGFRGSSTRYEAKGSSLWTRLLQETLNGQGVLFSSGPKNLISRDVGLAHNPQSELLSVCNRTCLGKE
jgi:hypothetical protein